MAAADPACERLRRQPGRRRLFAYLPLGQAEIGIPDPDFAANPGDQPVDSSSPSTFLASSRTRARLTEPGRIALI